MKKILAAVILLSAFNFQLASLAATSTDLSTLDNALYIESVTLFAGQDATLSVRMKNNISVQTIGVKIILPEGIDVVYNEDDEEYDIQLSTARTSYSNHALSAGNPEPHRYNVGILGVRRKAFTGTDGEVFTMHVNVSKDLTGQKEIHFTSISFDDTSNQTVKVDDVCCLINVIRPVESVAFTSNTANVVEGCNVQLTANVSPSTADIKTLQWSSSNEAIATVNAQGLVTAVSSGTTTITAATTDGTNLSANCTVRVIARGDVDGSGIIDAADITADLKFILGDTDIQNLYAEAADYNRNDKVTTTDAIAIVRLALTGTTTLGASNKAKGMTEGNKLLASDGILTGDADIMTLPIRLTDYQDAFTSMQFDVVLPEGISLEGVSTGSCTTDHEAVFAQHDGFARVIVYSMSNDNFIQADSDVLRLSLKCSDITLDGSCEAQICNIKLVRRDVTSLFSEGQSISLTLGNATCISNLSAEGHVTVYTTTGQLVYRGNSTTDILRNLPHGLYIINGQKAFVR